MYHQETEGVCVASYEDSTDFPAFFTRQSGFHAPYNVTTPEQAARLIGEKLTNTDIFCYCFYIAKLVKILFKCSISCTQVLLPFEVPSKLETEEKTLKNV